RTESEEQLRDRRGCRYRAYDQHGKRDPRRYEGLRSSITAPGQLPGRHYEFFGDGCDSSGCATGCQWQRFGRRWSAVASAVLRRWGVDRECAPEWRPGEYEPLF